MNKRIKDKINEIKKYLEELLSIKPIKLRDYIKDLKTKAACERYFEKIIEAVIDLSFLVIKEKGFELPEEDSEAFNILEKEEVISVSLSEKLKDAKGMRNILAHQYGAVDDELVFNAISEEIESDVSDFINTIKKNLE